jgi:Tol biopolymer transport system component
VIKKISSLSIAIIVFLSACEKEKLPEPDYLGQKPPGMAPELFAPGIISTHSYEHSAPSFSPDGSIVLWTVVDKDYRGSIFEMKYDNGKWSKPYRPSFADRTADDYYPSFSSDGKKLYFSSRRKVPSGYPTDTDIRIWEVERNQNKWGKPVPFDTTISKGHDYAHSITKTGTLYFSRNPNGQTSMNISQATRANGVYSESIRLPYTINSTGYEDGPFIAPDETFLIFESDRPEGINGSLDLYITFKNEDGGWSIPTNMGPKINSAFGERFARLSPDGNYLFFGSTRAGNFDIYWIDARIIEELKNTVAEGSKIEIPLGEKIITALDKNNLDDASTLLKEWLVAHPNNLDAIIDYSSVLRKLKRYSDAEQFLASKAAAWNDNISMIMEMALAKLGLNKNDEASKLLLPILTEGEQQRSRYKYLSSSLLSMGNFKASDEYFEKAMAINSNRFEYHRRAREYALIEQRDKALENLNKAVELGHTSRMEFENDRALEPLKSDIRFQKLLSKLE